MSKQEGFVTSGDDPFDEAAAWHARWRNASESGLSAEEVDQWAEWSKVAENKAAYDAVEFVSGSLRYLKPPPLPTAEELGRGRFRRLHFRMAGDGGTRSSATAGAPLAPCHVSSR